MKSFLSVLFLTVLVGCAAGSPPSSFERGIYNVTTQRVEVVLLRTNVTATATNVVAVPGFIEIPILNPKEAVVGGIQTAGQVGATFGLPWLTPVLGLLGGLYAWWAEYRNSRKKTLAKVLTNNVQVGRETILATAGPEAEAEFVDAISSAQVKADVKEMAAAVKDAHVDKQEARQQAVSVVKMAKLVSVSKTA